MPALAEGSINRPGPRPRQQYDAPYYLSAGGYLVLVGITSRVQQQVAHRQTHEGSAKTPKEEELISQLRRREKNSARRTHIIRGVVFGSCWEGSDRASSASSHYGIPPDWIYQGRMARRPASAGFFLPRGILRTGGEGLPVREA